MDVVVNVTHHHNGFNTDEEEEDVLSCLYILCKHAKAHNTRYETTQI